MMNYYGFRMVGPAHSFISFGWIFGVIFWILFILLIVGLIRWYVSDKPNKTSEDSSEDEVKKEDSALEILKKRYARGEITFSEFEKMKKDIK